MDDQAQQTLDQIRVNIAFEKMVTSVLTGAALGGALTLLLELIGVVLSGFSFGGLLVAVLNTVLASFLIFLVGFFASVAIGAPLFISLEKNKRRNVWPYLAAAIAVAIVSFVLSVGGLPAAADFNLGIVARIFVPAIFVALMFARMMAPVWRAAEKAEAEAEATQAGLGGNGTNIVRLH